MLLNPVTSEKSKCHWEAHFGIELDDEAWSNAFVSVPLWHWGGATPLGPTVAPASTCLHGVLGGAGGLAPSGQGGFPWGAGVPLGTRTDYRVWRENWASPKLGLSKNSTGV